MPEAPGPDTYFLKIDELQYHPFKVANIEIPLLGFELKGSVLAAPTQAGSGSGSGSGKVKYEPAKVKMQLLSELNAIWNSLMATGQVAKSLDILIYNARNLKYQIHFENITVTSVATSIESSIMTDEVIFLYTKVRWSKKDKSLDWDLEKNKTW